jgi:hypothetical protein
MEIASIAMICQRSPGLKRIFTAETRRKSGKGKNLPLMNADDTDRNRETRASGDRNIGGSEKQENLLPDEGGQELLIGQEPLMGWSRKK